MPRFAQITGFLLLALWASSAASQNLIVNGGFDRDLSGWSLSTSFIPERVPGSVDASEVWTQQDALGRTSSGGVRFYVRARLQSAAQVVLSQCVPVTAGTRYTAAAHVLVESQVQYTAGPKLDFWDGPGCNGNRLQGQNLVWQGGLPPDSHYPNNSNGKWLAQSMTATAPAAGRSVLLDLGINALTGSFFTTSAFDGVVDNVSLVAAAPDSFKWILPTSARMNGVGGSFWTTDLTLSNPSDTDALLVVKLLGNNVDGRSGEERLLIVPAGCITFIADVLGTLYSRVQDYGAILVTSTSPALVVVSETSTPLPGSSPGTVGESLPAAGPSELVGSTRKTLAPVRENTAFRTNLMLANATGFLLTVDIDLFDIDGAPLSQMRVDLPPLGMTQLNHVVTQMGVSSLDVGRLSLSTDTPGGLFAAYASVINNGSNDPRALLPR
jgi:hypothetical protein